PRSAASACASRWASITNSVGGGGEDRARGDQGAPVLPLHAAHRAGLAAHRGDVVPAEAVPLVGGAADAGAGLLDPELALIVDHLERAPPCAAALARGRAGSGERGTGHGPRSRERADRSAGRGPSRGTTARLLADAPRHRPQESGEGAP